MTKAKIGKLLLAGIGAMLVAWLIGMLLEPYTITSCTLGSTRLSQIFIGCWSQGLAATVVKVFTVIVLSVPLQALIGRLMAINNFEDLAEQQITPDNNDSPAILGGLATLALVYLVKDLPFMTFVNYLDYLLWKGGFALLLTILFAFLALRVLCRINSVEAVNEQMRKPGVNAVAIWIGASALAAAFLV